MVIPVQEKLKIKLLNIKEYKEVIVIWCNLDMS